MLDTACTRHTDVRVIKFTQVNFYHSVHYNALIQNDSDQEQPHARLLLWFPKLGRNKKMLCFTGIKI